MRIQTVATCLAVASILVAACSSTAGTFGSSDAAADATARTFPDSGLIVFDATKDGTVLGADGGDSGGDGAGKVDATHPNDAPADGSLASHDAADASLDHGTGDGRSGDGPTGDARPNDGATTIDAGLDATSHADAPQDARVDTGIDASAPPTFVTQCGGVHSALTGVVFAPNGVDPIPGVRVYAAQAILPYPTSYCDKCSSPIDPAYSATTTAPDGSFTLDLDEVPAGVTVDFAIQIGRFRKHTLLTATPCQTVAVAPASAAVLPGNSAAGNIPKIAVASGEVDHLDAVLSALGITEYDCYEGRKTPTTPPSTATCQEVPGKTIADVLSNAADIDAYHMAFLSCAPGAYASYLTTHSQATMTANTQNWVGGGGRLFVTDTAYDYIAQAFPAAVTWAGAAGTPQPVDGANIGCAPAGPGGESAHAVSYPVRIDDSSLGAWLTGRGLASGTPATASIQGFYQPWSTIELLGPGASLIADGTMPTDPTYATTKCAAPASSDVPLTAEFNVSACGRVLFSSFHTYTGTGTSAMAANEKIMEYLIFAAAACRG